MARRCKITIYVGRSRNASNTSVRTAGQYGALAAGGITIDTSNLPLYTTATPKAFWQAVLTEVQAQLAALP